MLVVAHPLTQPGELALPPLVVATLVSCVVALVAQGRRRGTPPAPGEARSPDVDRPLDGLDVAGRVVGVALLVAAVLAGRLGSRSELENLAPALVVGFAWPALLIGSALLPSLWSRINPWDGLARLAGARDGEAGEDVRWALPAALAWVVYLSVLRRPLDPGTVGAALAVYTIVTVAACLAVGRVRWLSGGEVFTLLFGWVALRRTLVTWTPPRGAVAVLGVVGGGVLFGALRVSELWAPLALSATWSVAGLLAMCALVAGLLLACERRAAAGGARGAVAAAAVPAVAALAVAAALARNRLLVSAQLLPWVLTDPLGRGWDPFGLGEPRLAPAPLGVAGLIIAQVAVLLAGHLLGALVARRRADRRARGAATFALTVLAAAGALAVTAV